MNSHPIPLVGPAYTAQSSSADNESLINFFVERIESPNGQVTYFLLPIPGLTVFGTAAQSPIRGMFSQDGRCFVVAGAQLNEVSSTGTMTPLGVVAIDQYPATLCSNGQGGHQLCVSSGNLVYIYNLNTGVFSGPHATGARMVAFLDGYFLRLDADASILGFSALEDGTTWDPLDVVQRNTAGDKWQAMAVARKRVWLVGSASTDVYWNSGDALNPIQPVDGAFFQTGIEEEAPFSLVVMGEGEQESVQWLAVSDKGPAGIVRATEGGRLHISTPPVDYALSQYASHAAVGWVYQMDGHSFYLLNFTDAGVTWANDSVLPPGLGWAQRGYWDSPNTRFQAYRPQYHTYCFNKHLVGDRSTGTIYVMDSSHATEADGTGIRRVRQCGVYLGTEEFVPRYEVEVTGDMGLGLTAVDPRLTLFIGPPPEQQGANPTIMLRFSDDRGKRFKNEHWRTFGRQGEYNARATWSRLGRARGNSRVYHLAMTDPVPWRLTGGTET